MKHLGDIAKIDGAAIEKVDCITFGSPCQDLSVAGKRAGLDGERSGLFMEAVRIIKEMRKDDERNNRTGIDVRPRYAIWENVPGAFSSNKGEDFRVVLEELIRVREPDFTVPGCKKWEKSGVIYGDDWSLAWRLMDAQYWGVPQRRKRIALIVDFGGQRAGEILFERESVSGNIESSIEAWQGVARDPEECTTECCTVKIRGGVERDSSGKSAGKGALVQHDLSGTLGVTQDQTLFCNDKATTIDSHYYKGQGEREGKEREFVATVALEGNGTRESHRGD